MRYYYFRLSNGENWFLKTEKCLDEIKNIIKNTDWIKLNSHGFKRSGDWTEYIPKEVDIQCCNIVSVVENENYQKRIDEWEQDKKEKLEIIHNIEKYEFNFKMRWWLRRNTLYAYIDKELEHSYLSFNKNFLNELLEKCKEYNCELNK